MKSPHQIWVTCSDYVSGPFVSRESAQRHIDRVNCQLVHIVEVSITRPVVEDTAPWPDDDN